MNLSVGTPWVDATAFFAPDAGTNTTRLLAITPRFRLRRTPFATYQVTQVSPERRRTVIHDVKPQYGPWRIR